MNGFREKTPDIPVDFKKDIYLRLNPDVNEKYANNPEYHYITYGYFENRPYKVEIPSDFSGEVYIKLNPDVNEKYMNNPEIHYINHGIFEKRPYKIEIPSDFSGELYLKLNPDIKEHFIDNPEYHYINHGIFEKRPYKIEVPSDFLSKNYLKLNPDVKEIYPDNAVFHYCNYGYFEKRPYKGIVNIVIYILCPSEEKLKIANDLYKKYFWAKPILLKYQDYSFENSFWKQIYEENEEWITCEMVGTLAYSAYKKINLEHVDRIIINKLYFPNTYFNFFDTNIPIPNFNTIKHPNFNAIWNNVLASLHLVNTTENCCNYWMCKPELMKYFIYWYRNICLPELLKHPLILENASYTGSDFDNTVKQNELIKLWGKPYYPNFPFICERLNKSFFVSYFKVVFLISHENSVTGAVNALLNVKHFYEKNNIKTILLYLPDIINNRIDLVAYVKETSNNLNCSPVVIFNTLCCYKYVRQFSQTNILTYWYIHEWYDPNGYYKYINDNLDLFESSINIIFICKNSYENLKSIVPNLKNEVIIYNRIPLEILEKKKK